MTLQEYLDAERIGYSEFARRIGEPHARTVERYAKGQRVPRPSPMERIREATGGLVTADSFYSAKG